jgi:DNA-directed RNA polymerase subunit RPC12/RpoP
VAIEDYTTCLDCTTIYRKELMTGIRCPDCHSRWIEHKERVLAKANDRALATAARELLMGISSAGKGEPRSPAFLDAFLKKIGGIDKFGEICGEEIRKSRGENPDTGAKIANAAESPLLTFKWAEMMSRVQLQNDARESLEIGHLSEDDLVSTLRGLATSLVQNDPAYRRLIVEESLRIEPDLLKAPSIDANEVKSLPPPKIDLSEVGIDDGDDSSAD